MERLKLNQAELAEKTGLSQAIVSGYVNKKYVPHRRTAEHMAAKLGIPVAELAGGVPLEIREGPPAPYGRDKDFRAWMFALKRHWHLQNAPQDTLTIAIAHLWPRDSTDIIAWLEGDP